MSNNFTNNLQLVISAGLETERQSACILFDVGFVVYFSLNLKRKDCQLYFMSSVINNGQMSS